VSSEIDPPDEPAGRGDGVGEIATTLRRPGQSTVGMGAGPGAPPQGAGSDLPLLTPGEQLAGRFTVLRFVARGGMGAVYEATDVMLRTRVALKVLEGRITADAAAMERFRREVLLARRVSHPSVCRVYELYQATAAGAPIHFLTMEFLEGETLATRIAREGRLSTAEALPLVHQMCEGLAAAHAEGVIHRDFKSGNVMLVPRAGDSGQRVPRVVITDFGVARALEQHAGAGDEALTGGAGILGTPEYMAPEQVTGGAVSPATDLYALGVVMYQMVSGRLPFAGQTPLATAARRIEEPPPRPELAAPGLDPRWGRTILRCLDRDPRRRFQDAADVVAALSRSRHGRWVVPAALAGGLLLLVAVALAGREWGEGSRSSPSTPAAAPPSIAVLPFVDMSPEHDQEYFSDGVAQEIMSSLTQVPGLRVAARSSSFSFKGKNEDLRSVAQKLNVGHILEGSVRKSGGRIRVTAQVVSAADGYQLWSQSFDRDLVDIFAIQDEIARAVVTALRMKVLPEGRASEARPTKPEAYALYLRGLQLASAGTLTDLPAAIQQFEKAIAIDPNYAPAHARLANALIDYGGNSDAVVPDWRERALEEAERAVALDPKLAGAYAVRGVVRTFISWDWPGARADFEQALALAPGDTSALTGYANLLLITGHEAESIAPARMAADLDPLSAAAYYRLGFLYIRLEQYTAAKAMLEKGISLAPQHVWSRYLGFAELFDGNPTKALAVFRRHSAQWVRDFGTALVQHSLGDDRASRQALESLIANASETAPYQIAEVYAWRGERDKAFEWLERAYATRDPGLCYVKSDQFLHSLQGDPRHAAMLARLKLPPN
jgi:serine/threonine protein kinase/tetratricopeptide (TPR) repeat protein